MRKGYIVIFILLLCGWGISMLLGAPQQGEIKRVLANLEKLANANNIEVVCTQSGVTLMKGGNKITRETKTIKFYADNTNKWRWEEKDWLMVYDGKYWWKYKESKNVYSKQTLPKSAKSMKRDLVASVFLWWSVGIPPFQERDPQGNKFWDLERASITTTLLDNRSALLITIPSVKGALKWYSYETKNVASVSTLTYKIWADPKTLLPLQIQTEETKEVTENPEFKGSVEIATCKIHRLSLDSRIPSDKFVFKPPKNAKEVSPAEVAER